MNAKDAKSKSLENKQNMETNEQVKKHDAFNADVNLLLKHFNDKIEEAINKGKLSTDPIKFASDRFPLDVVQEVVSKLKLNDFNVTMDKHNAYKMTTFVVSWA